MTDLISYFKLAFKISRYRFWMYLAGPYFVGFVIGANSSNDLLSLKFISHILYFLIVANIYLYGVNDLFDQDTDRFNVKKETHEIRIEKQTEKKLKVILEITFIVSIIFLIFQETWSQRLLFAFFLFLSYAYSAFPFRFKARPFIDFSSNILYALPGILAYNQTSGKLPPLLVWIGLYFWTGAMHLFSAVPDIEADKKANLKTTAVYLGKNASLWICFIFWLLFSLIFVVYYHVYLYWSIVAFIYPIIPLLIITKKNINIEKIYWYYPWINVTVGLLLTWIAGWNLFTKILTS